MTACLKSCSLQYDPAQDAGPVGGRRLKSGLFNRYAIVGISEAFGVAIKKSRVRWHMIALSIIPHLTPPLLFLGWPINATAVEPARQRMDLQAARYWMGPSDLATPRGPRPASHPPISLAHNNLHPPSPLMGDPSHPQPCRAASIPTAAAID